MATLRESYNSREFTDDKKGGRRITYRALITGAADETAAEDLALAEMPDVIGDDSATRLSMKLTNEGAGVFRVEAEYGEDDEPEQSGEQQGSEGGQPEPPSGQNENDPLGPEWNFTISESMQHITQALSTRGVYTRPELIGFGVPDYKNVIGLTKEKIEGCDVIAPKETRSVTLKCAGMTNAYLKRVRKLFGHTNSQPMMGCEIGEVLYVGFSAQYRAKELWSITHNFAIAENLVWDADDAEMTKRLTIGTIQLTAGKKAWDYLWVAYEKGVEAIVGVTVDRPRYAVIQQVYPEGNLKLLGV